MDMDTAATAIIDALQARNGFDTADVDDVQVGPLSARWACGNNCFNLLLAFSITTG